MGRAAPNAPAAPMSRRLFVAVCCACAAVLVLVVVGLGLGWWSSTPAPTAAPSAPLAVKTSLTPSEIFFGDPVSASVRVDLDAGRVAPGSLRIDPSFDPFVPSGPPTIDRTRRGGVETVVYTYPLQCVTDGCLPTGASHTVALRPVSVTAESGTHRVTVSKEWPKLLVASRLQHAQTAGAPAFRAGELPAAVYRVGPVSLADVLVALAVVLVICAVVLAAFELRALAQRRASRRRRTQLEIAVEAVRVASTRDDAGDRRKALELLAEALSGDGRSGLAESAERLAWAEAPPSPEGALELAETAATVPEGVQP
jgi:hypothetical protein